MTDPRIAEGVKLAWSCDEKHRDKCRNSHGCHCAEITALTERLTAAGEMVGEKHGEGCMCWKCLPLHQRTAAPASVGEDVVAILREMEPLLRGRIYDQYKGLLHVPEIAKAYKTDLAVCDRALAAIGRT